MNNSVRISKLKLRNFRNHVEIDINPTKDIIVIYGKNGSGKTNILESISLLDSHSGFRNSSLFDLIPESLTGPLELFGVNFQIKLNSSKIYVGIGLQKQKDDLKKIINIDGFKSNLPSLKKDLSVFWIVPKMSHLFQNSPEERRNFIDMMINSIDKSHSENLQNYKKLKKERIRILKGKNFKVYEKWLDVVEKKMCFSGLIICDARRTFLKSLNDSLKIINKKMSYIALELDGILDKLLSQNPALYVENFFLEKLRENRTKDSISGRTNFSANKTDLLLYDKKKKEETFQLESKSYRYFDNSLVSELLKIQSQQN